MSELDQLLAEAEDHIDRGDYNSAIVTLEAALVLGPDDALLHGWLAVCLAERGLVTVARTEAELAISLDPTHAFPYRALAHVATVDGKPREALRQLETALRLDDGDPETHVSVWRVKRSLGEQGSEALETARELDPDNLDVLVAWSEYEYARGDLDKAEQHARAALRQNPRRSDALIAMGRVLLQRGALDEAREHAARVLRADLSNRDALRLLMAVTTRRNRLLGLWYHVNHRLSQLGDRIVPMLFLYVIYRLVRLILEDLDFAELSQILMYVWLGVMAYQWMAPGRFEQMIQRELDQR